MFEVSVITRLSGGEHRRTLFI